MPQLLPKGSFHWGNQQQKACPHLAMQHTVELKHITDQLLSLKKFKQKKKKSSQPGGHKYYNTKNASIKFNDIWC